MITRLALAIPAEVYALAWLVLAYAALWALLRTADWLVERWLRRLP